MLSLTGVSKLNTILAFVMMVLWAPITSHCQLEVIPGLEFLQCSSDTSSHSDCEGDSCQSVESVGYKIQDNPDLVPVPLPVVAFMAALPAVEEVLAKLSGVSFLTAAPPELSSCWQFAFRTALPVRAPSFAS